MTSTNVRYSKRSSGFTLLELLVVVTVIAIIGGAMISSLGSQSQKAARGVATGSIAGVENAIRLFSAIENELPNGLESLICLDAELTAHPTAVTAASGQLPAATESASNQATKFGGGSNLNQTGGGLGAKVAGKFDLVLIDGSALVNSGITDLRYAEILSCDTDAATQNTSTVGANGGAFPAASLALISIPQHAFEDPRTGSNRNRGRGFSRSLTDSADSTTSAFMVWKAGDAGYNNVKVGGSATDVLVGLGIGQASELVTGTAAQFGKAPYYGDLAKDKYPHFIALFKVGTDANFDATDGIDSASSAASIVAVVDARGDFLDEEFAEFTGQKV
jgi:prepilin-type N-terminal cleavage/methylation domain-containing protein